MKIFAIVMSLLWIVIHGKTVTEVNIGVILDMDSSMGKMSNTCISMAIHDFYQKHNDSTTVICPHFRDSKQDNVQAASAAIDLLKNVQVTAILGPMTSSQADFVIDIGNKSKVPIISPATSPSLSPNDNPYFIRCAPDSSSQLKPIAELIEHFGWREVVFIYEDGEYVRGIGPYLSDAMSSVDAKIMHRTIIYPSVSDDWILGELYRLKTMQTRVFVVHALPPMASRLFKKVNEAGMMDEGYVWIITEGLTSRLDRKDIELMQGVIGVKSFIPTSTELMISFEKRWKREFQRRNPDDDETKLDLFGLWLYDTVFGLATAFEKIRNEISPSFRGKQSESTISDLDAIGTSETGLKLLPLIRNFKFDGQSGDFHVVDGELKSSVYQIVNIIGNGEKPIGFWSPNYGISKKLSYDQLSAGLGAITWPGDSHAIPKGWDIPTSNKGKLRVGVPTNGGFVQFIAINNDPETQQVIVTGFCVDVFNAVINMLPYAVKYEFIPFVDGTRPAGSYNDLLRNLSIGKYDAVVGDITILASRVDYVDFTLPYMSQVGISMIVPIKDDRKSALIFMKPFEKQLWITTGAFFIYTGIVIWVVEHRVNQEFRGPPYKQVGMIFWFSFSTLVFAHREKLISNLSRFVVIVWVFVVLVLTASYIASLASMLTVQQLQPTYTNITEILRNGESVGYQDGSFVADMLKSIGFDDSKLKKYSNLEQYYDALQLGSRNGGVSAIMDELPYIKSFLSKYCTKYTMIGPNNNTAGFGFAFPKGSSLVHDVSRAVLQVTEEQMMNITNHWFGNVDACHQQKDAEETYGSLTLDRFKGLFLVAGLSSTSSLLLFLFKFFYENREMLVSVKGSTRQKLATIAKTFDLFKGDDESIKISPSTTIEELGSPTISLFHEEVGVLSNDEEFYTIEVGAQVHESILVVETTTNEASTSC